MIRTEMKSRIEDLENRFSDIYEKRIIGDWTCFVRHDGSMFILDYLLTFGALVVGYADNEDEARLNRFEDGDLFYLDDMSADEMFAAMRREIEL